MFVDYVASLIEDLKIEPLVPMAPGVYPLELEDDITVKITTLPQGYSFSATVTSLPEGNKEGFFSQALQANLFGQGTHGAILGLNEDGNVLTLSKAVEYNSDYKEFKETLEDFISTIVFWRDEARTHK